jgi:transcriptional regulator with XRE-family HTH domain
MVQQMMTLRKAEGLTRNEHARRAGLSRNALIDWDHGSIPNLANMEAALNVLGYGLKIAPRRTPIQPIRTGSAYYVVAGVVRDNAPCGWTLKQLAAVLDWFETKEISNALGRLHREGRVRLTGSIYKAVPEDTR